MRYHLYFTVKRIIRRMSGDESMYGISNEFGAGDLYRQLDKVPWAFSYEPHTDENGIKGVRNVKVVKSGYTNHYKRYIPRKSNGLTKIGLEYLNQSIESYVYAVLGSQAKTRVGIVNHGGGSLESQQEFRALVKDAVINYSASTWILNMNKSITDTNVIQDLALSPKAWLIPSKMVILKNPIVGYNNLLKTASKDMKFGLNSKVNYQGVDRKQLVKTHQDGDHHLETLEGYKKPRVISTHQEIIENNNNNNNSNLTTLVLSSVLGVIINKYII